MALKVKAVADKVLIVMVRLCPELQREVLAVAKATTVIAVMVTIVAVNTVENCARSFIGGGRKCSLCIHINIGVNVNISIRVNIHLNAHMFTLVSKCVYMRAIRCPHFRSPPTLTQVLVLSRSVFFV